MKPPGPWSTSAREERALVSAEDLNVAPGVLGLPLASPQRRLRAMVIDLIVISAVGAVVIPDRLSRDIGDSDDEDEPAVVAPHAASGVPAAAADARAAADAADMTVAQALGVAAQAVAAAASAASQAQAHAASGSDAKGPAAAADPAAAALQAAMAGVPREVLVARVQALEKQLAEARRPQSWVERTWHWLRHIGLGYGGSLLYFTVLPAYWRGQTLGKRLLKLRTVELTGKPMTLALAFRRYGGYLAGMATGGFGLMQVLWDRNRQGLQDKVAHTVVVDEREGARAAQA